MTFRWVVDVAPRGNVPVRWRTYSLTFRNEGFEIPEEYRELSAKSRGARRVVEAVGTSTATGRSAASTPRWATASTCEATCHALPSPRRSWHTGLPRYLLEAADDERWDKAIRYPMDEAIDLVGDDVGFPILLPRR